MGSEHGNIRALDQSMRPLFGPFPKISIARAEQFIDHRSASYQAGSLAQIGKTDDSGGGLFDCFYLVAVLPQQHAHARDIVAST